MPHLKSYSVLQFYTVNKCQSKRIVLVIGSHIPDNDKAMSQSMVQKKSWIITKYMNVNNCGVETKHSEQNKALNLRR